MNGEVRDPQPVWVIVVEIVVGGMLTAAGILAVTAAYLAFTGLW